MKSCANEGGVFRTSLDSDRIMVEAHTAGAARVGAAGPDEIVFRLNSTSLTLYFSRMVSRTLKAGDEIMLTRMAALSNHADRPTMPGIVAEKKR